MDKSMSKVKFSSRYSYPVWSITNPFQASLNVRRMNGVIAASEDIVLALPIYRRGAPILHAGRTRTVQNVLVRRGELLIQMHGIEKPVPASSVEVEVTTFKVTPRRIGPKRRGASDVQAPEKPSARLIDEMFK